MSTVHGFRVGKRHTDIPCERVPSGRHRWLGDENCRRCGRNYYEVTKNWTGSEVRQKRRGGVVSVGGCVEGKRHCWLDGSGVCLGCGSSRYQALLARGANVMAPQTAAALDPARVAHEFAIKYGLREHLTHDTAMDLEKALATHLSAWLER